MGPTKLLAEDSKEISLCHFRRQNTVIKQTTEIYNERL